MDVAKLMNVLMDISTPLEAEINDEIMSLSSYIASNQSKEIRDALDLLRASFSESSVNAYNSSNLTILEDIEASSFFGIVGYNKVVSIVNRNQYDIQKIVSDLNAYVTSRKTFLDLTEMTVVSLKKLKVSPHFHSKSVFEIGILMPSRVTDDKIINITKELNRWDKVFKTIKEVIGEPVDDTKIDFISNGSFDFFIDNDPQVAACLAIIIERVMNIYVKILEIKKTRDKLKSLGALPASDVKSVEKFEKDIFDKEIAKTVNDIFKEFVSKQVESGRVNELKIAMKGHVIYVAKCINNGIILEINPPELEAPSEPTSPVGNDEKKEEFKEIKKNYDTTLKKIEIVRKSMETVKEIGKIGIDVVRYLTDGEEPKLDDESKDQ